MTVFEILMISLAAACWVTVVALQALTWYLNGKQVETLKEIVALQEQAFTDALGLLNSPSVIGTWRDDSGRVLVIHPKGASLVNTPERVQ